MADINDLMKCYCKTREVQSLYTKLLNDEKLTMKETEVIVELIQCAASSSKKIINLCNDCNFEQSNDSNG